MVRDNCEMIVSCSEKTPWTLPVRNEMPRKREPRISDIQIRVTPAFLLRGSLKAVMPLEIASTPVRALVPLAKACSNRKGVMEVRIAATLACGGDGTVGRVPVRKRTKPTPTFR